MYFGQKKSCITSIFLTMFITLIMVCGFCLFLMGIILFIDSGYSGCTYDKAYEDRLTDDSKSDCNEIAEKTACEDKVGSDVSGDGTTIPKACTYRPSFIDIISGEFSD